jgi:hypothetical protein
MRDSLFQWILLGQYHYALKTNRASWEFIKSFDFNFESHHIVHRHTTHFHMPWY